tara:strand:+ start:18758 stop:19924 length:1167 start_codon:yes stop_codon:yes gene_type:complete
MKYSLASDTWGQEEISAIKRVMKKGIYSMSDEVLGAEKEFADYFGAKYCVMVNSGSSANLLAVAAQFYRKDRPWKSGDEIIVPALSWSTTYFPLQQYGLKVKFVDVDIDTLNISLDSLEKAIGNNTRGIFAVNILGNSNDFDRLQQLCLDNDIDLIEDNCESMGAKYNDRFCGTFGKVGTFSSFYSHHIATMEGGYAITDDEELYHIMLSLRAHGWTRNLPAINKVTGKKSASWFNESWNFVLPGYNLRPLEMSGAICREQIKKLDGFVNVRRRNYEYFVKKLKDSKLSVMGQKELGYSSWFGFSLIFESENVRDRVVDVLTEANIDCRPIVAGDFTKNTVIKYFDFEKVGELNNVERIDKCGLFVGNHQDDLKEEIDYLFELLKNNL